MAAVAPYYTVTAAAGRWGLPVRVAPAAGAKKLGRVTRGQTVAAVEADIEQPGWLPIQWLAVRDAHAPPN